MADEEAKAGEAAAAGEQGADAGAKPKDDEAGQGTDEDVQTGSGGKAKKGESVDVVVGDRYLRTYCLRIHGKNFTALAEEFAKQKGAELVPSEKIKALAVEYRAESKDTGIYAPRRKVFTGSDHDDKEKALELARELQGTVYVVG